jgi:signal transduction histidine kinase
MIVAAPEGLEGRFVRPRINSADLFRISTWVKPLVRVYGQVRFARPGLGFFLVVENTANVWVQTSAPGELAPGDFVDAVGWVEGRALVTDAIFRVEKPGTLTPPRETTPAGVKTNLVASHGEGVAVEGRLVEQQRTLTEDSLVMERDGVVFLARLLHNDSTQLPAMERGTRLQLTGVCQTLRMPLQENLPQTFAFQLWLSSPADAEILQRPSWWTAGRLVMLCGIILFFGLLAAGWAALLRRQVARQTAVIGGQLQREAVAEERVRIAREFHDTVQQQLAGINLELETTELNFERSPVEARESVKLSRQMIRHSLAETRQTIWDLRSPTLERGGLVAAIDDLASSLRKSNSAQIGFQTTGESRRLPGSVEQALFRIAQEAVTNALKHGQARHCDVTIDFEPRTVHLRVRDDGVGFPPGSTAGDGQPHFGVLGMQERANKMGATFEIRSQPGKGTTVDVTVALAP